MANQFNQIDQALLEWASRNQLVLHTHYVDIDVPEFRCIYTSSAGGECVQIWVDPPVGNRVLIHAQDIESRSDEAIHHDWQCSIRELPQTLDILFSEVRMWLNSGS